jgi:hypothetical protein
MAGCTLREVIGHPGPIRLLARLIDRDRLPHAMILEGPQGCGRRTLARAVAAAKLCPERRSGDACGLCAHCLQSAGGTHPDIFELPGRRIAPNGPSVEDARTVADSAAASPLLGIGKAIIIPDAELLRDAAANALLKIIEEPPPRTVIILTVASVGGLLGTIRSRAQLYRLQALNRSDRERVLRGTGMDAAKAAALAARGPKMGGLDAPPAPFQHLERLLDGLDLAAISAVIDALPSRLGDSGDASEDAPSATLTPAAVQRQVLRAWLADLAQRQRQGMRSPDPRKAEASVQRVERIARAGQDLDRNLQPRLVLEGLALQR